MIAEILSKELNIQTWQSNATIDLIDQGNTIPFIARYRKEVTGSLDDEILRKFNDRLHYLRNLEEKKKQVIESIYEQGKLTDELKDKILNADTLVLVDDIYRPFKPKKRTRATIAKEKGLEPLADIILLQNTKIPVEEIAHDFLSDDVETVEDAISGAQDIIAEIIADNADFRRLIRKITFDEGELLVSARDKELSSEYEMYYEYSESVSKIPNHRVLAINRGSSDKEKILKLKISAPIEEIIEYLNRKMLIDHSDDFKCEYNLFTKDIIETSVLDAYKRLIAPAIEREIKKYLTEKAEDSSIKVFSKNLEQLLMQAPIVGKTVLGWDPAFRTGCKLSVVNEVGKVLDTKVVFPTEPQNKVQETKKIVKELIYKYNIDIIAIGNGTASRESEQIVADIIAGSDVKYAIVNEAGASVYSASKIATEEFPDFDTGQRSATSIARRLQDPLAELVKIDPKSIGVGQYQHDMNNTKLNDSLKTVVEKSVNNVGVDLNTASVPLLSYVAGISKGVAKNIVLYRDDNNGFINRKELLKVSKLGPKTFEQCAGFMKVIGSDNPLDMTTVHPESYDATLALLKKLEYNLEDIGKINLKFDDFKGDLDLEELSKTLNIGVITLRDIITELKKPGRDPRDEMPQPVLRTDTLEIEDLEEGMVLEGVVRNVIDFGAFVDIGVHQDGLVHISQLVENKFVRHPLDVVSVGDIVEVKILEVDIQRRRIQLSMII
ncbi:Tex family protein [Methanobrevibacter filiformis]|uniref:30S ribosomal protein S1 n=1 Tax=Methanobrevibacter filiformis TaxID=55758 RepID=A0A166A9V9_9EURY|nr:Tex family protein [Methanobrevibacter filiformis]KZX11764.1 30S ribosomal protein S1 [Methanobrevibacter filiformis]